MKQKSKVLSSAMLVAVLATLLPAGLALGSESVTSITVATGPIAAVYDSGKGEVFVASNRADTFFNSPGVVSVISTATNTVVASIPVGFNPCSLAYDSAKGEIFVANQNSEFLSVISDESNTVVATVQVGYYASALAYDSAKGEIFVGQMNKITVVSDSDNSVVATIPLTHTSFGAAVYDPGKGEVFFADAYGATIQTANGTSHYVYVVSDTDNSVVAKIAAGFRPLGMQYDAAKNEIFVSHSEQNYVSVISDADNSVIDSIKVGNASRGLAYNEAKGEIYVANFYSNSISVISDTNNIVTRTINNNVEKTRPTALAYDSTRGELYATNYYTYSGKSTDPYYVANNVLAIPISTQSNDPSAPEWTFFAVLILIIAILPVAIFLRIKRTNR